jgi:hypothetical protein
LYLDGGFKKSKQLLLLGRGRGDERRLAFSFFILKK